MKNYTEVYEQYTKLLNLISFKEIPVDDFNRIVGQLIGLYFCMMPSATYNQSVNYVATEINRKLEDEYNFTVYGVNR